MKKILIFAFTIVSILSASAQVASVRTFCSSDKNMSDIDNFISSYKINVILSREIEDNIPNRKAYLGIYTPYGISVVDSAAVKGHKAVFSKKQNLGKLNGDNYGSFLQKGFYIVMLPNMQPVLLNGGDDILITYSGAQPKVSNSPDSEIFSTISNADYRGENTSSLLYEISESFPGKYIIFHKDLITRMHRTHDTLTAADFEEMIARYDFSDARLYNSPHINSFLKFLKRFFTGSSLTSVEAVKGAADGILACAARGGQAVQDKYCLALFNIFLSTGDPYYEPVLLHIYDTYGNDWIPENEQRQLKRQIDKLRRLAIGSEIPELTAYDIDGKQHSTNDIRTKYTILWFWDPDCDHCQEQTPVLHDFYQKEADELNFEVFAVEVNDDFERWKEFSEKHGLDDWINLSTSMGGTSVDFIDHFDIMTTPVVLLIDNSDGHKIVLRHAEIEEIIKKLRSQK